MSALFLLSQDIESPAEALPVRVRTLEGFCVEMNSDSFDPKSLILALREVVRAGDTFDWEGLTGKANPLVVAFGDLAECAAEFPATAVEYREQAFPALLLNLLTGIREQLDKLEVRDANLCSLRAALEQADGQLELSHDWDDDEHTSSLTLGLPCVGATSDLREFERRIEQALETIRDEFDFLVPDKGDAIVPLSSHAFALRGPVIDIATVELCHPRQEPFSALLAEGRQLVSNILVRLPLLPGNPYAQVVRELSDFAAVIRNSRVYADIELTLSGTKDVVNALREDLKRETQNPNYLVLRRLVRRLSMLFTHIEAWDAPSAEKSLAMHVLLIPFRGPRAKVLCVAREVLTAIERSFFAMLVETSKNEGWRFVSINGEKTFLPPWVSVSPDETRLSIEEAERHFLAQNGGVAADETTDFGGNGDLTADEQERMALIVD